MSTELRYITFNTDMGWIGVLASEIGLLRTTLPQSSAQEVLKLLGDDIDKAKLSPRLFRDLVERFRAYFSGHKVAFPDELDLYRATPFQRQVWQVTRLISYGETRSYQWVAEQIRNPKAVRAIGQALARNPFLIVIPCHRVMTSNSKLGGFSGGMEMKQNLLQMEAKAAREASS